MAGRKATSAIEIALGQLRRLSGQTPKGGLIGNEEDLIRRLGVSRITLRQAARLIEHEGLLRVRRGSSGGYFAARPDAEMVASRVCAYLWSLALDARHTDKVANALWIETLRQAAITPDRKGARMLAADYIGRISDLSEECDIGNLVSLEREIRIAVFGLIEGGYIDLLFRVNIAFSRQMVTAEVPDNDPAQDTEFARRWKKAKKMELAAIAEADPLLAMMAAMQTRKLWSARGALARR